MAETSDQPVAEEEIVSTEDTGVADEAHAQGDDQTEVDEDGNPIEGEPEPETEEIEYEGKKYALPKDVAKELAPALLRQSDYTRKTQEVAETKRALESRVAEINQQAEVQAQTLQQRVQLLAVEDQLKQYAQTDWRQYAAQYGAEEATVAMGQYQQLQNAKNALESDITAKESEHRLSSERASATALQEADQILSREITGYGPELVQSIARAAQSVGFTADELRDSLIGADGKADVRSFKLLARLHAAETKLQAIEAKTTKTQTLEKKQAIQPAKTVGQKGGGYKPGLDDSLPPEEWMRRRNAQLAKAR